MGVAQVRTDVKEGERRWGGAAAGGRTYLQQVRVDL